MEEKIKAQDDEPRPDHQNPHDFKIEDHYLLKTPVKYAMTGHKKTVTSLAFHPSYTQLASSSEDGSIKLWDFENGDYERSLKGHTSNYFFK